MSIFFISELDTTLKYQKINSQKLNTDILIGNQDNFLIEEEIVITQNILNQGNLYIKGNGFQLDGGSIINNGTIFFLPSSNSFRFKKNKDFLISKTISGDSQFTGFFTQESIENDFSVVIVGPENSSVLWEKEYNIQLGVKLESPFYFSGDKGLTAKNKVEIGDELYCNANFLQTNLYQGWKLILIY